MLMLYSHSQVVNIPKMSNSYNFGRDKFFKIDETMLVGTSIKSLTHKEPKIYDEILNRTSLHPPNHQDTILKYWTEFLGFGYYFCILPFRILYDPISGNYVLYENRKQKILRVFLGVLALIYYLLKLKMDFFSGAAVNTGQYFFDIAGRFFDTIFLIPMFYIFGSKGEELVLLFQHLHDTESQNSIRIGTLKRKVFIGIVRCCCILSILHPMTLIMKMFVNSQWEVKSVVLYFEEDGGKTLSATSYVPGISIMFSLLANLIDRLLNTYGDLAFIVNVVFFRHLTNAMSGFIQANCIEIEENIDTDSIINQYDWIKSITDEMNSCMSIITFSFIFGNVPFFSTSFWDVFQFERNNFERGIHLCVCFYYFISLFYAAKICKEIEQIKLWIWNEQIYSRIEIAKLSIVLHELNYNQIGIKAYGCLTVNYSTVGSIISLILTYSLLREQFQTIQ